MIAPKNAVGRRASGPFLQRKLLKTSLDDSSLKKWVLNNNTVSFTFTEDPTAGVRLSSWTSSSGESTQNYCRWLWQLNPQYRAVLAADGTVYRNNYNIYPSNVNFISPSQIPIIDSEGNKYFTFTWTNIAYDQKNSNLRCNVTIEARLPVDEDTLVFSISCRLTTPMTSKQLEPFNSVIVGDIHFPGISLRKNDLDADNENTVFSVPLSAGVTYINPYKHLRSPRFNSESFNYDGSKDRILHNGQNYGLTPLSSHNKTNFACPGWMSIPAVVYGDRSTKEGVLIYGLDSEGTNPKLFQWYADDMHLHIKAYHRSDHQVIPYGIGGYDNPSRNYGLSNSPTWTFCIRPFVSNSVWVDWEGFRIYREEVVPKQIEYGWLPKSFYEQVQDGDIELKYAELPIIHNTFGYTGTTIDAARPFEYYKNFYAESVNPNIDPADVAIAGFLVQPNYTSFPLSGTNPNDISANYFTWEDWASMYLGDKYGPHNYKAPDQTGINSNYKASYELITKSGNLIYHYLLFPFTLSTGSSWVSGNSGMDLVGKVFADHNKTFTAETYFDFIEEADLSSQPYSSEWKACIACSPVQDWHKAIVSGSARYGVGFYHDTLGFGTYGCYADSHTYYDQSTRSWKTITHPRGVATKYFNDAAVTILSNAKNTLNNTISTYEGVAKSSRFIGQCSEFPSDVNIKYVPISLWYSAPHPMFYVFLNEIRNPRHDALYSIVSSTNIDVLDDSTIETILALAPSLTHWASYIHPPNWLQHCPNWLIAHNQRAIQNDWSAPHITNALPNFLSTTYQTGLGTYGQALQSVSGEDTRKLDWASYAMTQWMKTNRVSSWHPTDDTSDRDHRLENLEIYEDTLFNFSIWSGYAQNLIKRMLRTQAYNPDYIYHGTIEHPLTIFSDTYSNETTTSALFNATQYPNLQDSSVVLTGLPKTPHTVRRSRDNNSLLLIIGNWYSGTSTFSGTFVPAEYGITNNYQVYSLDVNTDQHGLRTLEDVVPANTPFNIAATLGEYDFAIYEIITNEQELDSSAFSDLKTNYSYIRYAYTHDQVTSNSIGIAYGYSASAYGAVEPPPIGYKAPTTQSIVNNLPHWMQLRQDQNSNGWKLVNSWGMGLDNVVERTLYNLTNLNLTTSDLTQLNKVTYTDITDSKLIESNSARNLLFNSSFAIKDVARSNMPAGWESYISSEGYELSHTKSVISPVSIGSDVIKIGQQIILDNIAIDTLVSSVYIYANSDTVDVKIYISVEKTDGTTEISTASLTNRSNEWVRLMVKTVVNSQAYRVNYSILANCSDKIYICAPQLEVSSISTWSRSNRDFLPYYPSSSPFNLVYSTSLDTESKKIPVFPIGTEEDFMDTAIPTRIDKISPPAKDLIPFSTIAYGRKVDYEGESFRTEFAVDDTSIIERSLAPSKFDIFGRYSIRDLRYYENVEYGTRTDSSITVTLLSSCIRKNILFVLAKETTSTTSKYVLKTLLPLVPAGGENYLVSLVDFNLNLNFESYYGSTQIEEEVSSIAFSEVDSSIMLITTTNNIKYYYKLYFDYYYFNQKTNRLYLTEEYKNSKLTVI